MTTLDLDGIRAMPPHQAIGRLWAENKRLADALEEVERERDRLREIEEAAREVDGLDIEDFVQDARSAWTDYVKKTANALHAALAAPLDGEGERKKEKDENHRST